MTDRKASQEPVSTPLTGTEFWAGVQGSRDVQIPLTEIATYVAGSGVFEAGSNITLTFDPTAQKLVINSTGGSAGSGTVTSVGILAGDGIAVSGNAITTSGNFTIGLAPTTITPGTYNFSTIVVGSDGWITGVSSGNPLPIVGTVVAGNYPLASVFVDQYGRVTEISASTANNSLVGSYSSANITVDAYGRITGVTNGSGLSQVDTVTAGQYAYPSSVTVDSYGRVTGIASAANSSLAGSWTSPTVTVNSHGQITAIANGGSPALTQDPSGSYTLASVTVDSYGRVTGAENAPSNSNLAGSYSLAQITVDAYGRVTAAANGAISLPSLSPSPAGNYTYATITVDAEGRVTSASDGSAPSGGGGLPTAGDVIINPSDTGKNKISSLQGIAVNATTPANLNVLAYDATANEWVPMPAQNIVLQAPSGNYGNGVGRVSVGYLYGLYTQAPGTMNIGCPASSTSTAPQVLTVYKFANMTNLALGPSWTTTLTTSQYPTMKLTGDTVTNSPGNSGVGIDNRAYWEAIAAYSELVYVAFGMRDSTDPACTQATMGFTVVALNAATGAIVWSLDIGPFDGASGLVFVKDMVADPTGVILQTDANIYRINSSGVLVWTYVLRQSPYSLYLSYKTGAGADTVSVPTFYNNKTGFCLDYQGGMYVREKGTLSKIDVSNGAQIWTLNLPDVYSTDYQAEYSSWWSIANITVGCSNGQVAVSFPNSSTYATICVYNAGTGDLVSTMTTTMSQCYGIIAGNYVFSLGVSNSGMSMDQYTLNSGTLTKTTTTPIVLPMRTHASSATYDNYVWFSLNNATGTGTVMKVDPTTLTMVQSWSVPALSGFYFRGFAAGSQ